VSRTETGQEQWLDQWAKRIHHSGLAIVALPLLEMGRGLGFLASQALLLAQPVIGVLTDEANVNKYITLLQDPVTLERLIELIERKAEGDE
jgi:hypothetical protein